MTDQDRFRKNLTFSQRYGYEPLPGPMRLGELSPDLRRELWNIVRRLLKGISYPTSRERFFGDFNEGRIERVFGRFTSKPESAVDTSYQTVVNWFERIIMESEFNRVLDFIEITANELDDHKSSYPADINDLFISHQAAYWLDTSQHPCRFMPCANPEQGAATRAAIETLQEGGMDGATTHLRDAAGHINLGQYADSVKDSILAVESVAREIAPRARKTLGPALDSLEHAGLLKHPDLKAGFKKLYDYTSDEGGIRHALVFKDAPDVGQDEAVFMFGACASFSAYLVNKHQSMER